MYFPSLYFWLDSKACSCERRWETWADCRCFNVTSTYIFPPQWCLTTLAIYVSNSMEPCQKNSLLGLAASYVDSARTKGNYNQMQAIFRLRNLHRIEEICAALTALKRLRDQLIVRCQMCPAMNARVRSICRGQIGLKRLDHYLLFLFGSNCFTSGEVLSRGRIYCFNYGFLKGLSVSVWFSCFSPFVGDAFCFLNEFLRRYSKLSASIFELFLSRWLSLCLTQLWCLISSFFLLLLALCGLSVSMDGSLRVCLSVSARENKK